MTSPHPTTLEENFVVGSVEDPTRAPNTSLASDVDDTAIPPELLANKSWEEVTHRDTENGSMKRVEDRFISKLNRGIIFVAVPSTIGVAIGIGYYFFQTSSAEQAGRIAGAYCVFLSMCMTGLLIYLHLAHYTNPDEQRYIIRIILMVPIYSIDSYLALWNYHYGGLFDLVRDSYESYALYTFFMLLMSYLGGEDRTLEKLKAHKPTMAHPKPFCCLPEIVFSRRTFWWWKILLLQYVIIKPLLTLIAIPLHFAGWYEEGAMGAHNVWIVFSVIANVSVFFAFSVVVYFYQATHELLKEYNPLGKFMVVKAVVFLCFWQSVALNAMAHMDWIHASREGKWTAEQVATGIHDFIVCIEMAILSFVHRYVFDFAPYINEHESMKIHRWKVKHAFAVGDVARDLRDVAAARNRAASTIAPPPPLNANESKTASSENVVSPPTEHNNDSSIVSMQQKETNTVVVGGGGGEESTPQPVSN
eukprot:PhF_6_TR26140/c0_g1_i5/m.37019